jgi:hypothetical protein
MEKINQFSIQRFMLLMKRYLLFNTKTLLIGAGAISGTLLVIGLLQAYFSGANFRIDALVTTGQVFIFVSGLILTSLSYNEIHTPARSQFYLTLPATTAEKLFSNWFLTSIGFIIAANALLWLTVFLTSVVSATAWGSSLSFYNPLTKVNITQIASYLVANSIFFLGAIYFRQNNFLKTLLSLFVISMAFNVIAALYMYLLFGTAGIQGSEMEMVSPNLIRFMQENAANLLKLFLATIVVFSLTVSYFRLKEREV